MRKPIARLTLAGAAVAAVLGVAVAGSPIAGASVHPHATTVCDNSSPRCLNVSNLLLNQDNMPSHVLNATTGQAAVGRRLNLRQVSDTRSNEDFIVHKVGDIGHLCPNIIFPVPGSNSLDPTSYACLNYPPFYPVYQANFAPNSNETGQCAGALSATDGFKLRLVRCGAPTSFWVGDLASTITITLPGGGHFLVYFPLEFAADHAASNPLVATFQPDSSNPTNKITLQQENKSGGHAIDRQMWAFSVPAGFTI